MKGKHDRPIGAPGLLAGILAGSLLIAGCGQRGPLFLPQPIEPPPQAVPAVPAVPAEPAVPPAGAPVERTKETPLRP
jgi:predicted small lipoprotein YifL